MENLHQYLFSLPELNDLGLTPDNAAILSVAGQEGHVLQFLITSEGIVTKVQISIQRLWQDGMLTEAIKLLPPELQ